MIIRNGYITKEMLKTERGIAELNRQLDVLYAAGNYSGTTGTATVSALSVWETTSRPALPSYGTMGYNKTLTCVETYTPYGWFVGGGHWTSIAGRPSNVAPGSWGYRDSTVGGVTRAVREYWDGHGWNAA